MATQLQYDVKMNKSYTNFGVNYVALKPTIYKFNISLSDTDRDHYETMSLTVARHPSENLPRMMARIMAYSINAEENLEFSAGLSTPDEADIRAMTLDGQISLWIDVGEPSIDRIKVASRSAPSTKVYSFNSKSVTWWEQVSREAIKLPVAIYRFNWEEISALSGLIERTNTISITIADQSAYVATDAGTCEIEWIQLS